MVMTMTQQNDLGPLAVELRPQSLDLVIGQDAAVKMLKYQLSLASKQHSYLFLGPSGTGKTTCAKIMAKELECDPQAGVIELDAARHGDIDTIKETIESLMYAPMKGKNKMLILDEVHSVSSKAWQSLLKVIEEPPAHVFFALCTTEEDKVPKTIVTRCTTINLKPVSSAELFNYAQIINDLKELNRTPEMLKMICDNSGGSVRQMMNYLNVIRPAETLEEASKMISFESIEDAKSPLNAIMLMVLKRDFNWATLMGHAQRIESWGGMRKGMRSYMSKVSINQFTPYIMMIHDALDKMPKYPDDSEGLADLQMFLFRCINAAGKS